MATSLADPIKMAQLSQAVERSDPSLLQRFVRSLGLTSDEARSVVTSLQALPAMGATEAALTSQPPSMAVAHFWEF